MTPQQIGAYAEAKFEELYKSYIINRITDTKDVRASVTHAGRKVKAKVYVKKQPADYMMFVPEQGWVLVEVKGIYDGNSLPYSRFEDKQMWTMKEMWKHKHVGGYYIFIARIVQNDYKLLSYEQLMQHMEANPKKKSLPYEEIH